MQVKPHRLILLTGAVMAAVFTFTYFYRHMEESFSSLGIPRLAITAIILCVSLSGLILVNRFVLDKHLHLAISAVLIVIGLASIYMSIRPRNLLGWLLSIALCLAFVIACVLIEKRSRSRQ